MFVQATKPEPILGTLKAWNNFGMQHYSGLHAALDMRTAFPRPFLAFYPCLWNQNDLHETFTSIAKDSQGQSTLQAGHPPKYEELEKRPSYDTTNPRSFPGPTRSIRLGDICLARSGDKGANVNFGIFPRRTLHDPQLAWDWLRSWLSRGKLQELLADDWRDEYKIERVEFPNVRSLHFVVYGWLGRGVSSATTLDALGKGFADYMRDKVVDVPEEVSRGAATLVARTSRL